MALLWQANRPLLFIFLLFSSSFSSLILPLSQFLRLAILGGLRATLFPAVSWTFWAFWVFARGPQRAVLEGGAAWGLIWATKWVFALGSTRRWSRLPGKDS